jgi:putative DNA primase/helicase
VSEDKEKPVDYLAALDQQSNNRNRAQLRIIEGSLHQGATPRDLILGAREVTGDDEGPGDGGGAGDDDLPGDRVFGSDDGLAAELSERLGADWRYVPDRHIWRRWTGQYWEADRRNRIKDLSRHVCGDLARQVKSKRLARQIASDRAMEAAIRIASSDPRHVTLAGEFDPSPWHLNTPAGIVDLTTGQLLPHDRDALMTCMTAASPEGDCPRFKAFLAEAAGGDAKLQGFLQRVAGYCLTGSVEEHAIFFLFGPGGTGKSLFLNLLKNVLGDDYAKTADMDLFTVAVGERHKSPLAMVHAARLVIANEADESKRLDEAKVKTLTGGDVAVANYMRGDSFEFRPKFKLLIAGNERPHLRSADDAMRRRLHVIPFRHKPKVVDKELLERLRPELGGILCWAIEGELERRRIGLAPPPEVVGATDEYFEAENVIGRWLEERCTRGDAAIDVVDGRKRPAFTSNKAVYRDYRAWAKEGGEFVLSERFFIQKLSGIDGLRRGRGGRDGKGERGLLGVALKSALDELPLDGVARGDGAPVMDKHGLPLENGEWRSDPCDEFDR